MISAFEQRHLKDQRYAIVLQLGVLLFILAGLFSTMVWQPRTPSPDKIVDLNSVPVNNNDSAAIMNAMNDIDIRAESAIVWDVKNQTVLYTKNADAVLPLASITKLMTAMLAYELIAGDTRTTVSLKAIQQEGSSGLVEGEALTIEKLSQLALISSSNDAAYELAASAGKLLGESDPTAQFIRGMNIRAEELGLDSLNFRNTTGLDLSLYEPSAVGSARDVSLLLEHILQEYPEILDPTRKASARIYNSNGTYHDVVNTNEAILAIPNLLATKTGYTDLAGGNLTIAFDAGLNRPIIITVLGSTKDARFSDVLTLTKAVQENI